MLKKTRKRKPKPRPTTWTFHSEVELPSGKTIVKGDELTVEDYTVNPLTGQNHRRRVRLIEYVEASHGEAWINVVETYSRDGQQHSTGRVRSFGLSRVRQVHRKKKRVLSAKELRARRQQEAV